MPETIAFLTTGSTAGAAGASLSLGQVAAGVGIVSGVAGLQQGRQASKASKRQTALQQRMADLKNQRQRRQAIRAARIKRAEIVSGGEQAGIGLGSSAVAGGAAGVGSQTRGNLSFLDQSGSIQQSIFAAGSDVAQAKGRQAAFGAVGDIAGKFADYKSIFK